MSSFNNPKAERHTPQEPQAIPEMQSKLDFLNSTNIYFIPGKQQHQEQPVQKLLELPETIDEPHQVALHDSGLLYQGASDLAQLGQEDHLGQLIR